MCSLSRTIEAAYSSIFKVKTVMGPTKSTVKKSRFIACATDIIQCNSTGTSSKECPRVGESDCERKSSKTMHDYIYAKCASRNNIYTFYSILDVCLLYVDLPSPEYPSCLQTTLASGTPHRSSHTVPHAPFEHTSTRPSLED